VAVLQPWPANFHIEGKAMRADISAASRERSLARLSGSWSIRPNDGAFRPLSTPIKTGSRTDAPVGLKIR
jgi:hypothetical protein